jgi:hypothetical protein
MNNKEAKFLLQGYRPDGRDAQDPQFEEALEQVKRDPALEQWFREQQAFDSAVSGKLRSVPVPATLKSDILAGHKTLRPAAWWTRRSVLTALAACLAALLGLSAMLLKSPDQPSFANYQADMVNFVKEVEAGRESLQLTSSDVTEIQHWIEANSIHRNLHLPPQLTEDSGVGCRVMDWNGHSVALACFRIEGGQIAHLLVIDRSNLSDAPHAGTRAIASLNGMNTAAWSGENQTYLLVSSAPPETLERLL